MSEELTVLEAWAPVIFFAGFVMTGFGGILMLHDPFGNALLRAVGVPFLLFGSFGVAVGVKAMMEAMP